MRIYDLIQLARQYMLLGVIVVILLLTGYFLLYKKLMKGTDKLNKFKFGLWSIFVIYIVVVLEATIGHRTSAYGNINLHLFSSYKNAYNSFSIREWRNIILNILMFVPLGFMMPLLFKKCKRWYITYLIGFGATLFIEILQLISKRGIFELDDIINNTLGCIIGYGIVIFFISIYEKRYKVLTNIIYQIPLIITVISFSIIFITYSKKELGNLSIINSYNIDMSTIDVSSNIDFNDKSNKAYVYKASVGDKEEATKIASEIFSKVNTKIDESQNDEYDDTIVFKSQDGNYSLWVNYTGNTTWFIYHKEFKGKENLSYKDVQALLSKFDIDLPKEASFEDNGVGRYSISLDMVKFKDVYLDGQLNCKIGEDDKVYGFSNNIISYKPYKEYDILTSKEAYNKILNGEFKIYDEFAKNLDKIEIIDFKLSYSLDTKGFYQPIYNFDVKLDGEKSQIHIPAIKDK